MLLCIHNTCIDDVGGGDMRNFYVLATALDYIEENITTQFTLDDVADAWAISLSNLHKLFRYALGYSIKERVHFKKRYAI